MKRSLPNEVREVLLKLESGGFESFVVGGSIRDALMGREPKDWDIATNARPEKIQEIFPDSFYENNFGTVTVQTNLEKEAFKKIQITTYRTESKYTDKRHPDKIEFAATIEDDLSRRDFTVNAIALNAKDVLMDPYHGQDDIGQRIIRAVGNPEERFREDALRLMRAVRLATELNFTIEEKTLDAIKKNANLLKIIARERIRDEIVRIIMADNASQGIELLRVTGLLANSIPELLEGVGIAQNLHHVYTVWEHNIRALEYAVKKKYDFEVRFASLLHDVGKPRSKRGEGKHSTFYGHEMIGAKMAFQLLNRLRFSKEQIKKITKLVRWHLFYYNVGEVTESSVRRLIRRVGPEYIDDLIKVREADRIGSGVPKAKPYRLRHLEYVIDKVSSDPLSVGMLKINGNDIMKTLKIEPGPKVGLLLKSLLAEVLDEPAKNTKEYLIERAGKLDKKSADELRESLAKIDHAIEEEEQKRGEKYWVKP